MEGFESVEPTFEEEEEKEEEKEVVDLEEVDLEEEHLIDLSVEVHLTGLC